MLKRAIEWFSVQRNRAVIYRVLLALGPVAVAVGLLTEEEVAIWLAVAAETLGVGMAVANTSTKEQQ
jgi:hypothetical protein